MLSRVLLKPVVKFLMIQFVLTYSKRFNVAEKSVLGVEELELAATLNDSNSRDYIRFQLQKVRKTYWSDVLTLVINDSPH